MGVYARVCVFTHQKGRPVEATGWASSEFVGGWPLGSLSSLPEVTFPGPGKTFKSQLWAALGNSVLANPARAVLCLSLFRPTWDGRPQSRT